MTLHLLVGNKSADGNQSAQYRNKSACLLSYRLGLLAGVCMLETRCQQADLNREGQAVVKMEGWWLAAMKIKSEWQ
jgi:hypothetical protein